MSFSADLSEIAKAICTLKGFTFIGFEGKGTFKQTFKVKNSEGIPLALKVHHPGFSQERHDREISAMQRCNHTNVGKFYSIDTVKIENTLYVWTLEEYIDGGNLTSLLKKGALDFPTLKRIGKELIDAVSHISSFNLVHRDLKPDNIMFRKQNISSVIVDFGLVRDLSESSITKSWIPRGPGTPLFAPPEQLNNDKELIDWRSDQFALGVTLSYSFFGRHPYQKVDDQPGTIVDRVCKREGGSEEFIELVNKAKLAPLLKMTAAWPIQRYRTPSDLTRAWNEES